MTITYKITKLNQFFTENYINNRSTITAAGADAPSKLYDNRAETPVIFTAATSLSFRCDFYDKYGIACTRQINRVILQGVSGATSVNISYVNSDDETVLVALGVALGENNLIEFATTVTAKAIILTFAASGATFTIKQIRVVKHLFDLAATSTSKLNKNSAGSTLTTKNGTAYQWTDYLRRGLQLKVENGQYAQREVLLAKEAAGEAVTILPFQDFDFFCFEGFLDIDDADISRFSSLVGYTINILPR